MTFLLLSLFFAAGFAQELVCTPKSVEPQFNDTDRLMRLVALKTHAVALSAPSFTGGDQAVLSNIEWATGKRTVIRVDDIASSFVQSPDAEFFIYRLRRRGAPDQLISSDPLGQNVVVLTDDSLSMPPLLEAGLRISPDNQWVAFAASSGAYLAPTRVSGGLRKISLPEQSVPTNLFDSIAWSPNSTHVTYRVHTQASLAASFLYVVNIQSSPLVHVRLGERVFGGTQRWSYGGQKLVWSHSRDSTSGDVADVYVANLDGSETHVLDAPENFNCLAPEFNLDDSRVVMECTEDVNNLIYSIWASPTNQGATAYRISNQTTTVRRVLYAPPANVIGVFEDALGGGQSAWLMDSKTPLPENRRLTPLLSQQAKDAGASGVERVTVGVTSFYYFADLVGDGLIRLYVAPLNNPLDGAVQISPEGETAFFIGPIREKTSFQTDGGAYVVQLRDGALPSVERLTDSPLQVVQLQLDPDSPSAAIVLEDLTVYTTCIYKPRIIAGEDTLGSDDDIEGHLILEGSAILEVASPVQVGGTAVIEGGTLLVDSCASGEVTVFNSTWAVGTFDSIEAVCSDADCDAVIEGSSYSTSSLSVTVGVSCRNQAGGARQTLSTGVVVGVAVAALCAGLVVVLIIFFGSRSYQKRQQVLARQAIVNRDTRDQIEAMNSPRGRSMTRPKEDNDFDAPAKEQQPVPAVEEDHLGEEWTMDM